MSTVSNMAGIPTVSLRKLGKLHVSSTSSGRYSFSPCWQDFTFFAKKADSLRLTNLKSCCLPLIEIIHICLTDYKLQESSAKINMCEYAFAIIIHYILALCVMSIWEILPNFIAKTLSNYIFYMTILVLKIMLTIEDMANAQKHCRREISSASHDN